MDAADTRFAVSDSWVSTKAPVCGKSQRLSLFSEHHQQEGHGSYYWSSSSPRLPLTMGWGVLFCCPIWIMLFNTHMASPPPPHTPSTHLLLCLPVLLTPLDGLPSCQLLPPNANTKTGSLFEQAEVYYPKYITPVLQRKNILNQHICTIYFYSKVMTGFLREFLLAIRLTKNSFAKWFMMIIIGSVCFKKNLHKCGSLQSHSALIGNSDLWMSPFPGFSTKGPLPTIFASCFPQNWGARQGKLAFLIASFLES